MSFNPAQDPPTRGPARGLFFASAVTPAPGLGRAQGRLAAIRPGRVWDTVAGVIRQERQSRKPEAAVFDLDGVLADSEGLHLRAWEVCLRALEIETSGLRLEPWVGVADTEIVVEVIERFALSVTAPELLERKRMAFGELVRRELTPFPGLEAPLRSLGRLLPLAVATASARREAELMLSTLGIGGLFQSVTTGDDVKLRKPAPDGYLLAAARLGADPLRCLAVEDSPLGIRAAKAAGMQAFAVTTTFSADHLIGADRVFPSTAAAIAEIAALAESAPA